MTLPWPARTFALAAAIAGPGLAGDYPTLKFSGFATLVGGRITTAKEPGVSPDPELVPPVYIADWSNWGTYTTRFTAKPESRAGIQADAAFTDWFRFTGQAVYRAVDGSTDLAWAYLTLNLTKELELQVGRKRIPLYYYSDFQDIGFCYPWVSAPPELYGWEVTSYNGASLRYRTTFGTVPFSISAFGGQDTVKNDRYMRSYGQPQTDATWEHIAGGDLETTLGWLTLRGVYLTADNLYKDHLNGDAVSTQKLKSYGLALDAEFSHLFILAEVAENDRLYDTYWLHSPSFSAGFGVRMGKWTPFVTFSQYRDISNDPVYMPQNYRRGSFTLRYDLTSNSAVKVQWDTYSEFHETKLTTDSKIFRISLDMVF